MVVPAFCFIWLAKREDRFIPNEAKRMPCACSLITGSLTLAVLIGRLRG